MHTTCIYADPTLMDSLLSYALQQHSTALHCWDASREERQGSGAGSQQGREHSQQRCRDSSKHIPFPLMRMRLSRQSLKQVLQVARCGNERGLSRVQMLSYSAWTTVGYLHTRGVNSPRAAVCVLNAMHHGWGCRDKTSQPRAEPAGCRT